MVGVVLAWYAVRQEREFQRLIAAGDAALAADQTYGAIEAFSGALALKGDSMLAHLKRGDTYRRRGELTAALRDLREAATPRPVGPAPGRAPRRRQRRHGPLPARGRTLPDVHRARRPVAARALQTGARLLPERPGAGGDRAAAQRGRDERPLRRGALPARHVPARSRPGRRGPARADARRRDQSRLRGGARGARRPLRAGRDGSRTRSNSSRRWPRSSPRAPSGSSASGSPTRAGDAPMRRS